MENPPSGTESRLSEYLFRQFNTLSNQLNGKTTGVVAILPIANGGVDYALWTPWVPTLSGMVLGNGSLNCAYKLVGKTCFFRFIFTLGTTSTVGAVPYFTLPITGITPPSIYAAIGEGSCVNTGGTTYPLKSMWSSTTYSYLFHASTPMSALSATIPFTWASTNVMFMHGFYEVP